MDEYKQKKTGKKRGDVYVKTEKLKKDRCVGNILPECTLWIGDEKIGSFLKEPPAIEIGYTNSNWPATEIIVSGSLFIPERFLVTRTKNRNVGSFFDNLFGSVLDITVTDEVKIVRMPCILKKCDFSFYDGNLRCQVVHVEMISAGEHKINRLESPE